MHNTLSVFRNDLLKLILGGGQRKRLRSFVFGGGGCVGGDSGEVRRRCGGG